MLPRQPHTLRIETQYEHLTRLKAAIAYCATLALLLLFLSPAAMASENGTLRDDKANRIVSGIISFTRWPALQGAPQLCVFASARHLNFPASPTSGALPFSVVYLENETALASTRCDALYFGSASPQQQTAIMALLSDKAVLSLAENNAECTIGAAFCLIFNGGHPAFSVNLDSLARSGVKVSADVLLLSRKGSH